MIFLDNAGTTKMAEECLEVYREFACDRFFNPSALAVESLQVSKIVAETEKFFLKKLDASEGTILFTGCATESNNTAIHGSLRKGDYEYVFSAGEHPSVYNVAKRLELDGYKVFFVPLGKDGKVDLVELEKVLSSKTRLISIMQVSNETGAVNDIEKISALKKKICPRAIFHVDGVQGFMKMPLSLRKTEVDLYSFSAHKIHGPKGVAGLYVKNRNALKPLLEGGGQQYGLRSGTENVPAIMQFRKVVEITDVAKNFVNVSLLKEKFKEVVSSYGVRCVDFTGSPYILNIVFDGVKGETMLHALDQQGVVIGLGSACSAKKAGNRVLGEIGVSRNDIISSARISFSAYQTVEEIVEAAKIVGEVYKDIKQRVS